MTSDFQTFRSLVERDAYARGWRAACVRLSEIAAEHSRTAPDGGAQEAAYDVMEVEADALGVLPDDPTEETQ